MTKTPRAEVGPKGIDEILSEFDDKKDRLLQLCQKTKALLEESLDDAAITYQSVQARVKSKKKLAEKYNDPRKSYAQLSDITDLAGLRVITYYEDEVDQVASVIRREFEVDAENSIDRRAQPLDGFGYHAVNFVCRFSASRSSNVEYKRLADIKFEIQITSILRHAWAEIEHDWYDLKEAFPPEIKRRFYRMAALLEVAESEFLELRKKKNEYQRSIALQIEANIPQVPLNAVSIAAFIEQEPLVSELDQSIALVIRAPAVLFSSSQAELASKILQRAGLKTVEEMRVAINANKGELIKFCKEALPYMVRPENAPLAKGSSLFRLGMLLIARKGESELSRAFADTADLAKLELHDVKAISDLARDEPMA